MSEDNTNGGRRKREKNIKSERLSALEKLKQLKGSKHKYEISEVDNVYEEIDEREYSKRVQARQEDNWIIDDDGIGYIEDGREIFDDDLDDESIIQASRKKKRGGDHGIRKRARVGSKNDHEKASNIRSMLMNMPAKKEAPVSLDDDDILGGIMQEIKEDTDSSSRDINRSDSLIKSSEESAKNYLKNFSMVKPKAVSQTLALKCGIVNKESSQHEKKPCNDSPVKNLEKTIQDNTYNEEDLCATMFQDDFSVVTDSMEEVKPHVGLSPEKNIILEKKIEEQKKPIEIEHQFEKESEDIQTNAVPFSPSDPLACVNISMENLPLVENADGNKVLRFFWLDAHEEPLQPGVVFLFGKVWIESAKMYVSCCLTIRNIERKVLVLPKEKLVENGLEKDITFPDVYSEFSQIAAAYGIMEFRSRKVEMHNCFTPDVPHTCEYMEIKYSAKCKKLPNNLNGKTFSHVFGTGTNALERFLIERHIKGPCWLDVQNVQIVNNGLSWCKVEMNVEKMEMVTLTVTTEKMSPPPVVLLALQIRTVVNSKNSSNEVALVVGLVNRDFPLNHEPLANKLYNQQFAILGPLSDQPYPYDIRDIMKPQNGVYFEKMDSERALLSNLLAKIQRIDPDFIVGHDVVGFDFEILVQRLLLHKVSSWSRFGRLRRNIPSGADKRRILYSRSYLCGRLSCDVMLAAKEHVQGVRSYDLESLCSSVLGKETHPSLTFEEVRFHYESGSKLKSLIEQTYTDTACALQIMCQIAAIPLALQITNIAGNVMSRTLIGGRAERNEYLLLHAFYEKNFIPPEKISKKSLTKSGDEENENVRGKARKKPNYSGGLVLEPKKGLYDQMILVMDFNSLYPSIIMEYNICFTTVSLATSSDENENFLPEVPSKDLEIGILPAEIQKLVENRVLVRNLMKDSNLTSIELAQLQTRQIALKLMANSTYGCLGYSNSRFYAKPLAALITAKGREILMKTKEYVENMNYEVIYGDTDSIMINTNSSDYDEVTKIGKEILQSVNKLYRCVNLDIDGIYKYMLLLKKKKYAVKEVLRLPDGTVKTKITHKGLDIVRRDWSRIAIECGNFVVEQLLSDLPLEEKIVYIGKHLQNIAEDLRAGRVPLVLLTISKQLTRSINQYTNDKSQPHVFVARRLLKKGMCHLKAGDTVSYIICEDGSNNSAVQRAYHLDELKSDEQLKVDYKYYLENQIHPVINRILEPVPELDACRIAELLGLDPSPYRQALLQQALNKADNDIIPSSDWIFNTPEHLEKYEKFSFTCVGCKTETVVDKPFLKDDGGNLYPVLSRCSNSKCSVLPAQFLSCIQNKLSLLLRSHVDRYYQGTLVCEDPACPEVTRELNRNFHGAYPVCTTCLSALRYKEVSDRDLYMQLFLFQKVFDIQSSPEYINGVIKIIPEVEAVYGVLYDQVTSFLNHNSFSRVNLGKLFHIPGMPCNIENALKDNVTSCELEEMHIGTHSLDTLTLIDD